MRGQGSVDPRDHERAEVERAADARAAEASAAPESTRSTNECLGMETLERLCRGAVPADDDERAQAAAARAHLANCSECRRRLGEMRDTEEFLSAYSAKFRGDAPAGATVRSSAGEIGAAHDSTIRDDFPGYAIDAVVDVGGQGVVYRARQVATGRVVAIKVPVGDAVRRPAKRYRFQREIELTARLDHPGIVHVLGDCAAPDGRVGCVMEFVVGQRFDDWAEAQRAEGATGRRRMIEAMRDVADAIAYAHQRAVLHRDLKPSNVIVTEDGRPRVLDFGLAKALDDGSGSFATMTGAFLGTLAYAAPEQIDHRSEGTDVRTDVHGLGLLLFQALTGRLPWSTEGSSAEIAKAVRDGTPARPTSEAGPSDAALDAIVLKAIAKEKDRRYASAAMLSDDLERWLTGAPVRARFDSGWYVVRATAWRHRWALSIAALVILTLGALIALAVAARTASIRANYTNALRDAGAVESHWAAVANARAAARDNFVFGEVRLWDLLLQPEPALVAARIEGEAALARRPLESGGADDRERSDESMGSAAALWSPPTSPAWWALWETYAQTPLVASLPTPTSARAVFERGGDRLIQWREGAVRIWNWRRGTIVDTIPVPSVVDHGFMQASVVSVDGSVERPTRWIAIGHPSSPDPDSDTTLIVVDIHRRVALPLISARSVACMFGGGRLAIRILRPNAAPRIEIWDFRDEQPTLQSSYECTFQPDQFSIDPAGEIVAIASLSGHLTVLDAATGNELLCRSPSDSPLYRYVGALGTPGELTIWGNESIATLRRIGDRIEITDPAPFARTIPGLRTFAPSSNGDRYAIRTERSDVFVGSLKESVFQARAIPAMPCSSVSLSTDGRHLQIAPVGDVRCTVVDLDAATIRRVMHPCPVSWDGAATVFRVVFSEDGKSLLSVSMDGSLRRYALPVPEIAVSGTTADEAGPPPPSPRSRRFRRNDEPCWFTALDGEIIHRFDGPSGLTRLAFDGDAILVGTHDLGREDAKLLRIRNGKATTLLDDGERWFCGLIVESGVAIWALSGDHDARLIRLDPADGSIQRVTRLPRHLFGSCRTLTRLSHRRLLLAGPSGEGVRILDDSTLEPVAPDAPLPTFHAVVTSPVDPDLIATTHDNGSIRLWRLIDDRPPIDAAKGRASGDVASAAPGNAMVRLELVREIGSHAGAVYGAAFHPSGRILATGGGTPESRDVRLWDIKHGRELAALSLFDMGVFSLAFSADGRWLAAAGEVDRDRPEDGGQFYLIDLTAPDECFAGNLEYHIARWSKQFGRAPAATESLRRRFGRPAPN